MPATSAPANAIMMEVTVEGHTITAQELQSDDWTPVLYNAYASRLASSPKQPHHSGNATSEAANPNARNAAHDATLATRSGKTLARLPPATKETRLTVQLVVRPRGELRLLDVSTPRLTKAVQTQLRRTLPDDFCLRTHPTNNTFTMATTHSPTAETLKTLTSLAIGDQTYPCTAYVAPTPGYTRGVITNAYDDETPMQLYQDLVRRNPEYTILAARRMGKTHSILITLDANAVSHSIKDMGAIHRCTLYRGSPGACTDCRQPGHRRDVCQNPKTNLCPRCGTHHSQQDPPCTPKCILCEGPHLTGTGLCKGRNLHQPRKQPSHPEMQQQESVPPRDSFLQFSSGATQPNQHKQAWTEPLKQAWNTPLSSHKHTTSMTVNTSLQHALAKSQAEAAAVKAEATAARAEAAALRQCIAKLEGQISALATGSPISPTPAPTAPQPPPLNPPNDHTLPSHSNPTSSPDSLAMEADTEPSTGSTNSTPCTTTPPFTPMSLDDVPTLLESFAARFEAKLQDAVTHINQECATLKDAVIHITQVNAALNHRFDVRTQGFSDRYSDLESRLNSYATRLTKLDSTPRRRKKPKAAEGQDNPIPTTAHDSHPPVITTPNPTIDSHDGSSKPAARTVVLITDITDWSKQLESDVRSVTRPLRGGCSSDRVDSRLLHLWEAKAGLERRWQRQRWNRTLRRRLAQIIKTLQTHAQQTTRLTHRIANRRAGLRERNALRLIQAYIISRTTYVLPYLALRQKERDRVNALLRSCTKIPLRLPPSTSNDPLLKLGVHKIFEELTEATITAQISRLTQPLAALYYSN
ncbi:hypothetical protein HPB49_003599 [Dermacentor silvarum]|uniref:Uncharacterized protein n=1 Tax=Dermacentor silvarum TaxID=543639 RepID=A0ACB8D2L5_DERSI|nr:hypothetical protein HPB49_003599 [Dermacentor silvarum]